MAEVAQLRKGSLELAILALLNQETLYGGALVARLEEFSTLDAGPGTVYPVLTRLAKAKLVTTSWQESASGPPRKYYALTDQGASHLREMTAYWQRLSTEMAAILTEVTNV